MERAELENPSPRKILADRTIHLSYTMPITSGALVICDFGAGRLGEPGQKYTGDVMSGVYRAPEIVVGMDWDSKIDIWSVGVIVCKVLLSPTFCVRFPLHYRYRSGTYSKEVVSSVQSTTANLTTSSTLPRWCRSWDPRQERFWNEAICVVGTGTWTVGNTRTGDNGIQCLN